ncbi:hypothetical protein PAXRUDRAFT_831707 [Paxillus rubicundulus Ve08.2h10]|uniref:Uncharacterized protein n=1 Tax=Paxillus rubicundulus Ve08.2h10 TaxID=930991 RepID=A0A0D0D1U5_9AGAM|nr:hypothetical protein PAXRUDRAFT_831707 [Paxillus rubicundulus Ve08.2h10]
MASGPVAGIVMRRFPCQAECDNGSTPVIAIWKLLGHRKVARQANVIQSTFEGTLFLRTKVPTILPAAFLS